MNFIFILWLMASKLIVINHNAVFFDPDALLLVGQGTW
jgi:hypothetical protein